MNRKHYLLELFNGVEDRFVVEVLDSRASARTLPGRKRVVLLAAAIALTALLVGCAAVYFWLQDMSIGTDTYTRYYDDQGKALSEPVEIERQVLIFAGYSGSKANQAASEWFAYRESYDPDHELMTNEPDLPDIENNYEAVYGCYTRDMVAKLDQIAEKYGLKLLDLWIPIQRWQSEIGLKALGITSFLKDGAEAKTGKASGMLYPPYNYSLDFELTLTGEDAAWTKTVWADAQFYHKDYLPDDGVWYVDLDNFQQWNYTTTDGTKLLLALSKYGTGIILCQQEEGFQSVAISSNPGTAYPEPDQVPGKKALEQMAECLDFSFPHLKIDREAIQPELDAAEKAYQAAHAPEVYAGYEDYIRETCLSFGEEMRYVHYDLDADGEAELLLSYPDSSDNILYQLILTDGQVETRLWAGCLCEGNVLMDHSTMQNSAQESWQFWRQTFAKQPDTGEFLGRVLHNADGTWQLSRESNALWEDVPTVTQAEAEAFLAQFTPLELDWQSLDHYRFSDGTTVGDYKKSLDVPPANEDLPQLYADWLKTYGRDWYTHYRILDINHDGLDDLLLSGDGDFYWSFYTYRYGQVMPLLADDLYLCQGGVLENTSTGYEYPGTEIVIHRFFLLNGYDKVELDFLVYNKSTAAWQSDLDGTVISEAEAQAILAKYPRIDQGMRPLEELTS